MNPKVTRKKSPDSKITIKNQPSKKSGGNSPTNRSKAINFAGNMIMNHNLSRPQQFKHRNSSNPKSDFTLNKFQRQIEESQNPLMKSIINSGHDLAKLYDRSGKKSLSPLRFSALFNNDSSKNQESKALKKSNPKEIANLKPIQKIDAKNYGSNNSNPKEMKRLNSKNKPSELKGAHNKRNDEKMKSKHLNSVRMYDSSYQEDSNEKFPDFIEGEIGKSMSVKSNKHDKVIRSIESSLFEWCYSENQNPDFRETMEDTYYINDNFKEFKELRSDFNCSIFTIFDGHGGPEVANFCRRQLSQHIARQIHNEKSNFDPNKIDAFIEKILTQSFLDLDKQISSSFKEVESSGSTCCLCLIINKKLYCANIGDSKCLVIRGSDPIFISTEHSCKNSKEVERIKEQGGMVFQGRVFGQLILTRAFGDVEFKKYGVSSVPSISKIELNSDILYVLIASDGVWDVFTPDEMSQLSKGLCKDTAEELCKSVIKTSLTKGSRDNISCIVIKNGKGNFGLPLDNSL